MRILHYMVDYRDGEAALLGEPDPDPDPDQ